MTVPALRHVAGDSLDPTPQPVRPDEGVTDLAPDEIRSRLRRIRDEVSALPPVRNTPLGKKLLHDLDEVIESAGAVDPVALHGEQLRRRPVVVLPSGPDYPAVTHR